MTKAEGKGSALPRSGICVGQFAGAHGVRGVVKLRSFTSDPMAIFDYAPITNEQGQVFKIAFKSADKDQFLVDVEGIKNKEDADALRGDRLYVPRSALPKTRKGEYYLAELVGLQVRDEAGTEYGQVMAAHDHGAGVFLEIGHTRKDSFMLPFKDAFVPEVDLDAGTAVIVVPDGWLD